MTSVTSSVTTENLYIDAVPAFYCTVAVQDSFHGPSGGFTRAAPTADDSRSRVSTRAIDYPSFFTEQTAMRRIRVSFGLVFFSSLFFAATATATVQQPLPDEIKALVPWDADVLLYKTTGPSEGADILLILQKEKANEADPDIIEGQRPLILYKRRNGALVEVARSDKLLACSTCGIVLDDPFQPDQVRLESGALQLIQFHGLHYTAEQHYDFVYDTGSGQWLVSRIRNDVVDADPTSRVKPNYPRIPKGMRLADYDPQWKKPEYWGAFVVSDVNQAHAGIFNARSERELDEDIRQDCVLRNKCRVLLRQKYACMALVRDSQGKFFAAAAPLRRRSLSIKLWGE